MSELLFHATDSLDWLKEKYADGEREKIQRAFDYAALAHKEQFRKSGEPYITHCLAVGCILADMGMDAVAVCAGLLHDVVEDTDTTLDEIRDIFGPATALIVDGVTKLSKLECRSKAERQAESFRKMFLAMAKDIRVILIKLADRLHNMRTLDAHSSAKKEEIARETLEIYAPLAHRLGIFTLKNELEDLSLRYLEPERYFYINEKLAGLRSERSGYIKTVIGIMREKLTEVGIQAEISGRPKHYYSIYRKMISQNKDIDAIYDLIAVRLIVGSVQDCYAAVGIIHTIWKPVPGRFKDFVAMPKENMYQSIHTTVMGDQGEPFEIQIRTEEMHRTAEYGIAAHWIYKEGEEKSYDRYFEWLRQSLEWQSETKDTDEYFEMLKLEMFEDIVFVFTPKGDVKEMPAGSTPLDFAYRVHSDVGHRCVGCKVNGRIATLDYELRNGDIVEIMTSKTAGGPKRDWLNIARTSQAKSRIRSWFKRERRGENIEKGRELLEQALSPFGPEGRNLLKGDALLEVAKRFGFSAMEDFFAGLGEGSVGLNTALNRVREDFFKHVILPSEEAAAVAKANLEGAKAARRQEEARDQAVSGIVVKGADNLMVRLSHCCNPLPGDPIVGYITRGRGVSVHRADCPNAKHHLLEEGNRIIDVAWESGLPGAFIAELEIAAQDRDRLTSDILTAVADIKVPIHAINSRGIKNGQALTHMKVEIENLEHLRYVMERVSKVKGVTETRRVVPGGER
ncbi:MAG: bifunctional (p)ppGpp synthetase/guanosine-3',5'-bis(diphosphate) 3'-pyrophosphohydrolase [Peptococcaceae bacterium]|jgi:GTP pyrophosphokinase|nr:bifunctional (p)ppGpp synthetase/guanosine-3',5'-bis(diphosphate) 3'-pyrophosphohydrolase [Peptococcaceae bacterium]